MSRLTIINNYIQHRLNNNTDELLKLFADNCELSSLDGITYIGKEGLKQYYDIPQTLTPTVGRAMVDGYIYYVDLSFVLGLKTIRCFFKFDCNNMITKINLMNTGWF